MTITAQELAERLRAARDACGLKQEDAAAELGVSRSTVAQMELGHRAVSSLELEKLAYMYGRDVRDFLSVPFHAEDALGALFRAQPEVIDQPEVLQGIRSCIALGNELSNLEHLAGIDREASLVAKYTLPSPAKKWEAIRQGERVAAEERRRLELGSAPAPDVSELLEMQGIRTALADLPEGISGFTISDPKTGFFVVANKRHHVLRRRCSFAHEYSHVLVDRDRFGLVSRASDRDNLIEIRANAFAAAFLMPEVGVRQIVESLGKGFPSRRVAQVYDEAVPVEVEGRSESGSQEVQLYDVVQVAHHFQVSRIAALYRLRNLRLLTEPQLRRLMEQEDQGLGKQLAGLLDLPEPDHGYARNWFRHRFLGLAMDAYRREKISRGKLKELARMVDVDVSQLWALLGEAGLVADDVSDMLLPR